MISEVDSLKTNELLQRRKLRLQQVREQSKEIAKKIRQRAKVETLRQVKEVEANKEKEYLECQKKFVNKLQELYCNSLQNVGAGHKNASEHIQQDIDKQIDKSKLRGKEAVSAVRRRKQEILDKKKELLERKVQARVTANELSREKSNIIVKTLENTAKESNIVIDNKELETNQNQNTATETVKKVDMATQLNLDEPPNGYQTDIPILLLPENESNRDTANDILEKQDKNKRPNLFALSDEMPSSLRGSSSNIPQGIRPLKPSLTLVSEYIQNRRLRLRESEPKSNKKQTEDLQNIRQTIQRTRASKIEGSNFNNVCQVLNDQVISVPTWKAEPNCHCCYQNVVKSVFPPINSRKFKSIINSSLNNINPSRSFQRKRLTPVNSASTFANNDSLRSSRLPVNRSNKENSTKTSTADTARKSSVMMYNHTTRDIRTLPYDDEKFVVRDQSTDEDAFSKAQKEETNDNLKQKELQDKIAEGRNKMAMTKESVEKEYRDTLAFLNSLPKDMSSKPIKEAYMDEKRQQQLKENRQKKLQHAFKNIEKECRRHKCKHTKPHMENNSKSPNNESGDFNKDLQYSWMPVPEREGNLAIHNIPTTIKQGNTVKFSNNNDYHEYRSRHKHTPPTKDISSKSKLPKNRYVETVVIEKNGNESTDCSSITSDSSLMENIMLNKKQKERRETKEIEKKDESFEEFDPKLSDADRIVIYKILNSKYDKRKKSRKLTKLRNNGNKTSETTSDTAVSSKYLINENNKKTSSSSFQHLTEGVYKAVNENGDNMTLLQFSDMPAVSETERPKVQNNSGHTCCYSASRNTQDIQTNTIPPFGGAVGRSVQHCDCNGNRDNLEAQNMHYPSAETSTSSLKTAYVKNKTVPPDNGYIKFMDETGQENGKFYVGATGFLKDEAYEVIIQLRKKEINGKEEDKSKEKVETVTSASNKDANESSQNSVASGQANDEKNKESEYTEKNSEIPNLVSQSTIPSQPSKSIDNQISPHPQPPVVISSQMENINNQPKLSDDLADKISPETKKATSTYTQTSNSPIHRPIFMHMSSSTSTAYMSPPEIIMPRFLKRDYPISYDETYDSTGTKEYQNSQRYEGFKHCMCRHAINRKRSPHSVNILSNCKKINHQSNHLATPPNTESSAGDISDFCHKNYETTSNSFDSRKRGTCSKCKNSHKHNKEVKRNKHVLNKSSSLLHDANAKPNKHIKIDTSNVPKRNTKTSLNPIIKEYVNKLLELNKEGMKAVEIINEDCSSVTTPSSSIINETFNTKSKLLADKKISLEQIKNILKEKIINEYKIKENEKNGPVPTKSVNNEINKNLKLRLKLSKRKQLHHKVKSLNISKKISKSNKIKDCKKITHQVQSHVSNSTSSSFKNDTSVQPHALPSKMCNKKTSTPPRKNSTVLEGRKWDTANNEKTILNFPTLSSHCRSVVTPISTDSENVHRIHNNYGKPEHPPPNISTQTSGFDSDNNFMKVAEGKLQNMEKIADLTEKCTKRLSNLAKVLEEVRRNKSLVYSQITSSDSTSDSDLERNKRVVNKKKSPLVNIRDIESSLNKQSPPISTSGKEKSKNLIDTNKFVPLLTDIPKPINFKSPLALQVLPTGPPNIEHSHMTVENVKLRGKPPPALSRIHLKNELEPIVPHELSTVLEVDSPMSLKFKSRSRNDMNTDISNNSNKSVDDTDTKENNIGSRKLPPPTPEQKYVHPDIVKANKNVSKTKIFTTDSSDNSKLHMMDLNQFNEIMLKPFISIQDYAKKQDIERLDEASNIDDHLKNMFTNDDLSSLHSESSLPDVIAELLKRKIISEPFKFDTASNVNSSTISTESTISLLALSNIRQEGKKSNTLVQNKKKSPESSDTLSISSHPDLENAFQKLGMGWASSTLKKTKERLALSSSTNTSSSSGALRNKIVNNPPPNTDGISMLTNFVKTASRGQSGEASKNVGQQTPLSNSFTVKEFLNNELSKKITFTNKSTNNSSNQEFVSLYETKMPEEMKQIVHEEDQSTNSVGNCTNNRARTSTPVQILRSMTYHSSSSSNTSNGLFSNADELSSVKVTSNSIRNHSTSDKDDLTIPNYILRMTKGQSDYSKSD